ncbi:MAG: NAD(P)/FAD-dependent oxidoreductase [Deltaproteobacteria bacterium]|nr:NAD(P)/FAD-dependent oxidoreductase [Deltaproteobacteria bacterium]
MADVDAVVIGAGVVGAAVAEALSRGGRSVFLLEAGPRPGEGVSARNSGVIHSGLYYPTGSLKARACVRGNALLYEWCARRGVWHHACGKLVVATTPAQVTALHALAATARANDAPGVTLLSGARARELEPSIPALEALWCPRTGIVDAPELVASLVAAAQESGAVLLTHARVDGLERTAAGWKVTSTRGPVETPLVVNCAGLYSDEVARLAGIDRYQIHPCRGDYFRLKSPVPHRTLVYPVKEQGAAGLGVHLTLDRAGGFRLGPDVTWVERKDDFSGGETKLEAFRAAASRLLGPVAAEQLTHDGCGIRPKLRAPTEAEDKDFVVSQDAPGLVNLVGIESPGLTAALALAEHVLQRAA